MTQHKIRKKEIIQEERKKEKQFIKCFKFNWTKWNNCSERCIRAWKRNQKNQNAKNIQFVDDQHMSDFCVNKPRDNASCWIICVEQTKWIVWLQDCCQRARLASFGWIVRNIGVNSCIDWLGRQLYKLHQNVAKFAGWKLCRFRVYKVN